MKTDKSRIFFSIFTFVLIVGLVGVACEGPSGTEGPRGPEGPQGPVGPAGEDGSMMYAGEGEPDGSIGDLGDYYLNQDTGELYGPKDEDGWGNPIIVLMGEDGQDGEDGSVIHSGDGAPEANLGAIGDFYFDQSSGEFYGPKSDDGWGNPTDLTGEDGQDGADGSVIHSGEGAPAEDVGVIGDYYLDKSTGEFYGPKTENGWGTPFNLTGEDGQDGSDGEDGKDGSQIYSGSGAPDASLGIVGDYYLDKDSYELYGPKTSNGWGTPLNLKGADGNANVTRYIYSGHDFSNSSSYSVSIDNVENETEMAESAFSVYLVATAFGDGTKGYYAIPGYGQAGNTIYGIERYFAEYSQAEGGSIQFSIYAYDGPGEAYDRVEVVRIKANETIDNRKVKDDSIIPDHLDISDYEAVADYYGFYK